MSTAVTSTPPPQTSIRIGHSRMWLIAIVLLAALLRFYALDASSLWSDEGNTYALVQRSFATIARDAAADIHPPGYYWLLKMWATIFGFSASAMRAFSALTGVLLVAVVYAIGDLIDSTTRGRAHVAIVGATLAALNPFQLYYSQEARMYMLLALAGALLFWALLGWMVRERNAQAVRGPMITLIAAGALGVWTHYSFPILLAAAGLAYLWHWAHLLRTRHRACPALVRYVVANLAVILTFAPWLPTAITRVLQWPQGGEAIALRDGIQLTLRTLTFGPLRDLPQPLWPWLVGAALLPLLGMVALVATNKMTITSESDSHFATMLALWLLAPMALMFGLGLFSDAFLKFLLVASPAWTLLIAAAPLLLPRPLWGSLLVMGVGLALAVFALPHYYTSPTVRDNYAGVAAYIRATGDATRDVVVLDAPGQGDVWSYYDPDLPTVGLPQSRPPDTAATLSQLAAHVQDRRQVFALFWATDEADPDRLVETWLDQHAFRGLESWQGNLRFVVYSLPNQLTCVELTPVVPYGDSIQLAAHCQPAFPQRVPAGQVALLGLQWQTPQPLTARYKVTVQLLDARNQVIAQHDAEPAGGSRPTDTWEPNMPVPDNHGLTIPFGTPPGSYRLIVALYDAANGQRLATPTDDAYQLGEVMVERPPAALPLDLIDMQRADAELGPVTLVGYAAHKKDHSHAPQTPLQPGDMAHFTLYWHAPNPLPADWPGDMAFDLTLGEQSIHAPLAGGAFPTAQWQAGEVIRGDFDLPYDGSSNVAEVRVGNDSYPLRPLPR